MASYTRRTILIGGGITVAAMGAYAVMPAISDDRAVMAAPEVLTAVESGDVLLVDVRRPDEWRDTGLAKGAVPIDMRRSDFIEAVTAARRDARQPVAVICARGVRSRRMSGRLAAAGIEPIIDVPEGMLGSRAGPGWLARGLPTTAWAG